MPEVWMPGVPKVISWGGQMEGPRHLRACVWHTSESPQSARPSDIARYVITNGSEYHLIWNPYSGEMVQIMPAIESARSLKNAGAMRTNRVGNIRIQVCVVGRAAEAPLTTSPLKGWPKLREWLASWGIPEKDVRDHTRSTSSWFNSGHTDHRSAPGNDHTDPGRIDFGLLFGKQPTAPDQEDDMWIVKQGSKTPLLLHGSRSTLIDEASMKTFSEKGVEVTNVSADVYDRLKRDDNHDQAALENRLDKIIALLEKGYGASDSR